MKAMLVSQEAAGRARLGCSGSNWAPYQGSTLSVAAGGGCSGEGQRVFPALSSWKQGPRSVRSQRMCPLKEAMPEPGRKPGQHPQRGQMSAESEAME